MELKEFLEKYPTSYRLTDAEEVPENLLSLKATKEELLAYFQEKRVVKFLTKGAPLKVYVTNDENFRPPNGLAVSGKELREILEKLPAEELTGEELAEVVGHLILHLIEKRYGNLLTIHTALPVVSTSVVKKDGGAEKEEKEMEEKELEKTENKTPENAGNGAEPEEEDPIDEFLKIL